MRRKISTRRATSWRVAVAMAIATVSAGVAWAQSAPAGRPGAAAAQDPGKDTIAVMDLIGVGTSNVETQALTERLREELLKTGRYKVVDRALMDSVLNEQQLQQTGCTSAECAVQVGKMLGVRKLVSGKIIKIGESQWLLSATMVDVETTETVRAESIQYEGRYFALLSQGIVTLVGKLSPALASKPAPVAPAAAPAPQTAQEKPKASPGARPRVAVFPYLIKGGHDYRTEEVAQQCLAQLKGLEAIEIAYTFYPEATPGASLAADKAIAKSSWTGILSASPNTDLLRIRAQELGVDFIVQLDLYNESLGTPYPPSYNVRTFLYETKNNLVSSGDYAKLGASCTGERNATAVRTSVTDLIQAAPSGGAYASAPAVQTSLPGHAGRRIAVFPYLIKGGHDYGTEEVAGQCLAQLKAIDSLEIAYTFYPGATPGASLVSDKAIAKSSWSGVLSASPNTDLLRIRAQELGVEFILQLDLYNESTGTPYPPSYNVRTFLYESKSHHLSNGNYIKLGASCTGERNATAMRKSITDLIGAAP